jgi:thiaminase/transcriptional activator TenA
MLPAIEILAGSAVHLHQFLDSFLTLLGAALANADTFAARLHFGRFIGMVSAEENTFFPARLRGARRHRGQAPADPDTQATAGGDMAGYGRRNR